MIIEVLEEAEQDLLSGFAFYESQAPTLGEYFLNSVFSDIESLQVYHGVHSIYFGYHRLLAKKFPFAIYYKVQDNVIRIYAVLDCRRNPAAIRQRLM
jgi:hypothetical protein